MRDALPIASLHDPLRRRSHRTGTVRGRLRLLMVALIATGLVSAAVVTVAAVRQRSDQDVLIDELIPVREDVADLAVLVQESGVGDPTGGVSEPVDAAIGRLRSHIDADVGSSRELRSQFETVEADLDRWLDAAGSAGTGEGATETRAALTESLQALADMVDSLVAEASHEAETATNATLLAAIGTGVILLAAGGLGLVLVGRWITDPMDRLTEQVTVVGGGDLSRAISVGGPEDIASIGVAVEAMRRRLLDDASRRVDSALIAGHLAESGRIAGDLHDDQIQAMTIVSIRLQQVARRVADDPAAAALVDSARDATNQAIDRLRRMIFELQSPVLEAEGLEEAIAVYFEETFGDDVVCTVAGDAGELDPTTAALAYRLAREAMFNAFKHADARQVGVEITSDGGVLTISVVDDGCGFDPGALDPRAGHLGMGHARELAAAAGGTWSCRSRPGEGTTVRISLPVGRLPGPPGAE